MTRGCEDLQYCLKPKNCNGTEPSRCLSAYRMRDIVFNIMLRGVTSLDGIVMELNRQGIQGKEWKPVDVRGVLAGD